MRNVSDAVGSSDMIRQDPLALPSRILDLGWRALALLGVATVLVFLGDIDQAIRGGVFGHFTESSPSVLTRLLQTAITVPLAVVCWPTRVDRFVLGVVGVIFAAAITLEGRVGGSHVTSSEWGFVALQLLLLLIAFTVLGFPVRSARVQLVASIAKVGVCLGGAAAAVASASWFAFAVYLIAGTVAISHSRKIIWKEPRSYVGVVLVSAFIALACIWLAAS